jgi:hypothetical protein
MRFDLLWSEIPLLTTEFWCVDAITCDSQLFTWFVAYFFVNLNLIFFDLLHHPFEYRHKNQELKWILFPVLGGIVNYIFLIMMWILMVSHYGFRTIIMVSLGVHYAGKRRFLIPSEVRLHQWDIGAHVRRGTWSRCCTLYLDSIRRNNSTILAKCKFCIIPMVYSTTYFTITLLFVLGSNCSLDWDEVYCLMPKSH